MIPLRPWFRLVRFSALPSALADGFGGMALALWMGMRTGAFSAEVSKLWLLLAATTGIYLGGMALNDLLHVGKDRRLGKQRPLVAGEIGFAQAVAFTSCLYAGGLLAAWGAGCLGWAVALSSLTFLYNWLAVESGSFLRRWTGAPLMALCRAVHVLMPLAAHEPYLDVLRRTVQPGAATVAALGVFLWFLAVTAVSLHEEDGAPGRWISALPVLGAMIALAPLGVRLLSPLEIVWVAVVACILPAAGLARSVGRAVRRVDERRDAASVGGLVGTAIRGEALLMAALAWGLAPEHPWLGVAALLCHPAAALLAHWAPPT